MAWLLRWAALIWLCCSLVYITLWETTLLQLGKAFLPPLVLSILSVSFLWGSWHPDDPDDDGGGIPWWRWRELFEYFRLTRPVDRSREKKVVRIDEKKRA